MNEKFTPLVDKLFWWIFLPTAVLLIAATALAMTSISALIIMILTDLLVLCFIVSPLFGYVELRETCIFIKFGFFLSREIPYEKIRDVEITRKYYADSMISLKNSVEHVNIKYNRFDVVSVSVVGNEELATKIESKLTYTVTI